MKLKPFVRNGKYGLNFQVSRSEYNFYILPYKKLGLAKTSSYETTLSVINVACSFEFILKKNNCVFEIDETQLSLPLFALTVLSCLMERNICTLVLDICEVYKKITEGEIAYMVNTALDSKSVFLRQQWI